MLDSHQLAHLLLKKPKMTLVLQAGEDSRDNPAYCAVSGVYVERTDNMGDFGEVLEDEIPEEDNKKVLVIRTAEIGQMSDAEDINEIDDDTDDEEDDDENS
jgi:hypothetical protein